MTRAATQLYQDLSAGGGRGRAAHASPPQNWEAMLAKARGRARADGFEDGVAQAEARMDQTILEEVDALRRALETAEAVKAEADRAASAASCAALRSFLQVISPGLAAAGAIDAMTSAVRAAFEATPSASFVVQTSPATCERMRQVLSAAGLDCVVAADESLVAGQARLERSGGFDEIDLRPAIDSAMDALARAGVPVASGNNQTQSE